MAKVTKQLASGFETENTGGVLTGFLAEEDEFDPRSLWRLGSWGAASVGAVIVAVLSSQSSIGWRRELTVAADLARQAQQLQTAARESQSETRRLVSAVDTLNSDRDRLFSRVTVLEQGLDSVTGSIARQKAAAASPQAVATPPAATAEPPSASQSAPPAPVVSPVATTAAPAAEKTRPGTAAMEPAPTTVASVAQAAANTPPSPPPPLMASKSMLAPPDTPAAKLIEPEAPAKTIMAAPMPEVIASVTPAEEAGHDEPAAAAPRLAVQRTEFGVDVGGANSVGGLRALWRGLLKSKSNAQLTALRPIIVVKENNSGLGMQLRLVAGPLNDAATAAKICATLIESQRPCETTLFDGQRLTIKADDPPAAVKPAPRRRAPAKRAVVEEPKKPETSSTAAPTPPSATVSALFSKRTQ
jgi:hypothetical protein